jgi:hypothetical protein
MVLSAQPWLPADLQRDYWNNKPIYSVERNWEDIDKSLSNSVWKVVVDVKRWVATVFVKWETKEQLWDLSWVLTWKEKLEFIEKLKQLPDYNWSKVKEAVEKWAIEIKKIPNREVYAIYESRNWNIIYLVWLDWSRYTNIDYFRTNVWYEDSLKWGYIKYWYWKIELDTKTWLWKLYKKDWKEVPIFSDEYSIATLNAVNFMWSYAKDIINEAKKRRSEWRIK